MLAAPRQRRLLSDHRAKSGMRRVFERRAAGGEARQAGGDDRRARGWTRRTSRRSSPRCCRSPTGGDTPRSKWPRAEQKERTIVALIALFAGLTQRRPGAGAAGGRALDRPDLARACSAGSSIGCRGLRALLVVTFRPEFAAPWVGRAHVASLQLNRFGRRQALAMVDRRRRRQGAAGRSRWSRSSRRPTACRCSSRN